MSLFPRCGRLVAASLLAIVAISEGSAARAENWAQWRGPDNNGVTRETPLPTTWSSKENVLWRTPLPGPAGATPVVFGDRIFVSSAKGQDLVLLCLDTSGKVLWERTVGTGDEPVRGDEGNMASPSPSTDGKHVWIFMGTGDLACFTIDGDEVWKFNVADRFGNLNIAFGMSSTPVLDRGRLYLQLLHTDAALVVALDAMSGQNVWVHTHPATPATSVCIRMLRRCCTATITKSFCSHMERITSRPIAWPTAKNCGDVAA